MKTFFLALALVLLAACAPRSIPIIGDILPKPTATPAPTATAQPTPDPLAPYRADLIPDAQNDLSVPLNPTRYDLDLRLDLNPPVLTGQARVRYTNNESTALDAIYFRLFPNYPGYDGGMNVTRVAVNDAPASSALTTPIHSYQGLLSAQNTALRVGLAAPLAPGQAVDIALDYRVTIPISTSNRYADFSATDGILSLPEAYPLIPAYDAQGWHLEIPPDYGDLVYSNVSFYNVTVTVPSTLTVVASGSTIANQNNSDGTTTWRIIAAPMRDFDLNASDQWQKASTTLGATTLNAYYLAADAEAGRDTLRWASDAFKIYERRFGAYPYRELDVVETPTTAASIEYPGLVVIARDLYRDQQSRNFFEFAVAHEVAHQWWYGMVGDDQVNAPWLDEALAQYSTLIYFEETYGKQVAQTIKRDYFEEQYQKAVQSGLDAAVNQPVAAFQNEEQYAQIVYDKGPLFFDAVRARVGDERFFQFLQTYFTRFKYKNVTPDDLLQTAEQTTGASLADLYQQWILAP
jgi:hypothetical protein